jgi:HAD superfamily hydrolase (TIGR01484 family)
MTKRILICTDLDRTLLPNGSQPESPKARSCFNRLISRPEITLAYVSGRNRELVEEAIRDYRLPMPDWVIGDVGTTIYRTDAGGWQPWHRWEQEIAPAWRGLTGWDLRPLFTDLPYLRLQEESKQNRFKLSYYLPLPVAVSALRDEMTRRLHAQDVSADLIFSTDETKSIGLLDVLPEGATKLHALEFLMRRQGFEPAGTVFAGDSGNDLQVLSSAIPSVLVANASREVAEQAEDLARQRGTLSFLYLAQGNFLGMNGNYSAGILEGVNHYLPETRRWMQPDDDS